MRDAGRAAALLASLLLFLGAYPQEEDEVADDPDTEESAHEELRLTGYLDPREAPDNSKVALVTPFGQLQLEDVTRSAVWIGDTAWLDRKGLRLRLSLNRKLQEAADELLAQYKAITASVVAVESKTGRILAIASRAGTAKSPLAEDKAIPVSARAPAASLMKIVTATGALEKSLGDSAALEPDSELNFRGGCGHLRRQNWLREEKLDRQHLTLARAFGLSCNTFFARIALYQVGLSRLRMFAERYGFNKPLPSDLFAETSLALFPQLETSTALEVGEAGAGFGASKLSPLHAAVLSAAATEGFLMAPYLVDEASRGTQQVYLGRPKVVSEVASGPTRVRMAKLMQATTSSGTARRVFRRSRLTRANLAVLGGKTGTLTDAEDRGTLYTWFNGSVRDVSLGVLVSAPKAGGLVRASQLAQAMMGRILRLPDRPQAAAKP